MNAKKTYLHILTAVILGALLMFLLPVGNGLTADGVHMLGILIPVIYLWITVGTDWVSLAAIIALVMTGVMNNGKNYYADVYAGSPISHVLPLLLIAAAGPVLGVTISFGQWLMIGIPFEIMAFAIEMFVFRFIWKPDTTLFENYDLEATRRNARPLSTQGKISVVIFLIVVFFWLFPQFGKSIAPGLVAYLNKVGACVPPVLGLTAIFIIHVDGKPIAKFADTVKNIPMGMLVFTACVTVLGSAINMDSTGISAWLSNLLTPALSGLPTFAVMVLVVFLAAVITQFMSNTVTIYLMYAVGTAILSTSGINLPAFVMIIGFAAIMGLLTPAAAVPSPLFFGPEHITMKNEAKYCAIFLVLDFLIIMFVLWPLANVLIKF